MDDLPRVCEEVGVLVPIAGLFCIEMSWTQGPQQVSGESESSFTFVYGYNSTRIRASAKDCSPFFSLANHEVN